MKTISINTRIEGGKFKRNNKLIRLAVQQYEGKEIEIIFKRKYKQRSHQQNRFYWGVIVPMFQGLIFEGWGEIRSAEEIHEILKAECNYEERVNPTTGEIKRFPKSTAELTTAEWLDYEQKIRQFALDFFNTTIPEPNEQLTINFK